MKPKMNRKDLMGDDDIWNAVNMMLSEQDYQTEDAKVYEAFIVHQYYSELESGGHEALLNWAQDWIKDVGIEKYRNDLVSSLQKIGAHEYAAIERSHLEELWKLHLALEDDESVEEDYYKKIELMDGAYYGLDGKLQGLLEKYFVEIHTELIDVVEG
ncbi:DMP19 family protein [Planococcus beigongshangi]|uniref:DMP19 family protein n=1 Tax=Planococcus beigongshangi TaxID=2782536 RepID=UPI00193C0266